MSDTYANQGARAGAILPFTSATASLCAAVTVAVVELLPIIPSVFAQSAAVAVFPLCGSFVAAAATISKARCEVDAEAATAAANELSRTDREEDINPVGSTFELIKLSNRALLDRLYLLPWVGKFLKLVLSPIFARRRSAPKAAPKRLALSRSSRSAGSRAAPTCSAVPPRLARRSAKLGSTRPSLDHRGHLLESAPDS